MEHEDYSSLNKKFLDLCNKKLVEQYPQLSGDNIMTFIKVETETTWKTVDFSKRNIKKAATRRFKWLKRHLNKHLLS